MVFVSSRETPPNSNNPNFHRFQRQYYISIISLPATYEMQPRSITYLFYCVRNPHKCATLSIVIYCFSKCIKFSFRASLLLRNIHAAEICFDRCYLLYDVHDTVQSKWSNKITILNINRVYLHTFALANEFFITWKHKKWPNWELPIKTINCIIFF